MSPEKKEVPVPTYCCPARLVKLAAQVVTRCLIYEDENCYHYRWDPVNIWQYEIPQKKKKGRKLEKNPAHHLNDTTVFTPQPQWKEIKKFRDWWYGWNALGGLDSVMRGHIMAAVERCSWSSQSQEEDVLFLLLRLCIDTKIELSTVHFEKFSIVLKPCPALRTLVIHNVRNVIEEMNDGASAEEFLDGEAPAVKKTYIEVVSTILEAATDLKTLGVSVALQLEAYFHPLASESVQTLHLHMIPKPKWLDGLDFVDESIPDNIYLRSLLFHIVPHFPALLSLSIDPLKEDDFDLEAVEKLNRSTINVTRWRPEFFQELPSWDTLSAPNTNLNFHVM